MYIQSMRGYGMNHIVAFFVRFTLRRDVLSVTPITCAVRSRLSSVKQAEKVINQATGKFSVTQSESDQASKLENRSSACLLGALCLLCVKPVLLESLNDKMVCVMVYHHPVLCHVICMYAIYIDIELQRCKA